MKYYWVYTEKWSVAIRQGGPDHTEELESSMGESTEEKAIMQGSLGWPLGCV